MGNSVNPTNYDAIPAYADEGNGIAHAVIETPAKTRHKYAFEPKFGIMLHKLTLGEGLAWPYDYGFVPQTIADDGDPIDVLVVSDAPTFSGCLLEVRIIGAMLLEKNGVTNNRLVACLKATPGVALNSDKFENIDDVPKDMLAGIERFLVEYSEVEGNKVEFNGTASKKKALHMVDDARKKFKHSQK